MNNSQDRLREFRSVFMLSKLSSCEEGYPGETITIENEPSVRLSILITKSNKTEKKCAPNYDMCIRMNNR